MWARKDVNGRYYRAIVTRVIKTSHYCVYFEHDDSIADNIRIEDVLNWREVKHPKLGYRLLILNEKGEKLYGRHLGVNTIITYQVQNCYCLVTNFVFF